MPTPQRGDPSADANLLLLIGQLVEATKAASESLRTLGADVHAQATGLVTVTRCLEAVEPRLRQLEHLVHDPANVNNLIATGQLHRSDLAILRASLAGLLAEFRKLHADVDALGRHDTSGRGFRAALVWALAGLAWAVTTAVAIYAALGQWYGSGGRGP